jgi:phospholipid/cholesterol/gamma-HCH transport system ATP-binding protein
MLKCENVSFYYQEQKIILDDINLHIPKGKVTALMGTSGCGKTTLLRILSTLEKPKQGCLYIEDQDISKYNSAQIYALRKNIGMLFQFGALFTDLSVFENIAFPLRMHTNLNNSMIRDIVLMKLNAVGLRGCQDLMPNQISGGMSRRIALSRAIALDPQIVFYDEPFAGLDPISMGVIAELIKDLSSSLGLTSIIVSHDVHETFAIADYVHMLFNGKIIASGTPSELSNSSNSFVQQFIAAKATGPMSFAHNAKPINLDFNM